MLEFAGVVWRVALSIVLWVAATELFRNSVIYINHPREKAVWIAAVLAAAQLFAFGACAALALSAVRIGLGL